MHIHKVVGVYKSKKTFLGIWNADDEQKYAELTTDTRNGFVSKKY